MTNNAMQKYQKNNNADQDYVPDLDPDLGFWGPKMVNSYSWKKNKYKEKHHHSTENIQHLKHEISSLFHYFFESFFVLRSRSASLTRDGSGTSRPKSTRIRIYNTGWNTSTEQSGTDPWQWCPAGLACRSPRSTDLMVGGRAIRLQHRVLTPPPYSKRREGR